MVNRHKRRWIWLSLSLLLVLVLCVSIIPVVPDKVECGLFTATQLDLRYIAYDFYPEKFNVDYEILGKTKGQQEAQDFDSIFDRWGNRFKYIERNINGEKPILYSFGKNGIDEGGRNDDIVLNNYENRSIYCKKR